MAALEFEVGNYQLHEDSNFNYQLNRMHKIGCDLDEIKAMAAQITDIPSYVEQMKQGVAKAKEKGRLKAAVAYLRGQDFFTPIRDGKLEVYEEYVRLFEEVNADMLAENNVQKAQVPYETGFLPVLYGEHPEPKGTIVLHGGFDSYVQEHMKFMVYMYQHGYSAYIFEGPGQGEVINRYHIPFTPDWHKPVGAVLDHFGLDEVALVGISFGSLLCKRAAAKEPRVKYLFSVGVMTGTVDSMLARMPAHVAEMLRDSVAQEDKEQVNYIAGMLMEKSLNFEWQIEHGMYVFGLETPYDFYKDAHEYDIAPIADQVTQDYLIVAGANDHSMPLSMAQGEIDLMTNTRSFTLRVITAKEQGDDHCNVSNRKLMLDIFINWLEETKKQAEELDTIQGGCL